MRGNNAQKRMNQTYMTTNPDPHDKAATAAQADAPLAPQKATPHKRARQKNGAPARATGPTGGKTKSAKPAKPAKASQKTGKPTRAAKAAAPHAGSKSAKILEMIGRVKGATLAEIMKATHWQAHSVRGFLSVAAQKHHLRIESTKNPSGDRSYRIVK